MLMLFISSRVDDCNALLTRLSESSVDVFKLSKTLLRGFERRPTEGRILRLFQSDYAGFQETQEFVLVHFDLLHPHIVIWAVRFVESRIEFFQTVVPKFWNGSPISSACYRSFKNSSVQTDVWFGLSLFHILVFLCALIVSSVLFSVVIYLAVKLLVTFVCASCCMNNFYLLTVKNTSKTEWCIFYCVAPCCSCFLGHVCCWVRTFAGFMVELAHFETCMRCFGDFSAFWRWD